MFNLLSDLGNRVFCNLNVPAPRLFHRSATLGAHALGTNETGWLPTSASNQYLGMLPCNVEQTQSRSGRLSGGRHRHNIHSRVSSSSAGISSTNMARTCPKFAIGSGVAQIDRHA